MIRIQQGTTPTHTFVLPFTVDQLARVRITYEQADETILEKETAACTLEGNTISLTLTQEETLLFKADGFCKIQLHCVTGGGQGLVSQVFLVGVDELLSGEAL